MSLMAASSSTPSMTMSQQAIAITGQPSLDAGGLSCNNNTAASPNTNPTAAAAAAAAASSADRHRFGAGSTMDIDEQQHSERRAARDSNESSAADAATAADDASNQLDRALADVASEYGPSRVLLPSEGRKRHISCSSSSSGSGGAAAAAAATATPGDKLLWPRKPERMGTVAGMRNEYVIDDSVELKLNLSSYRMVFVMNKDVIFYKLNSLAKSRKVRLCGLCGSSVEDNFANVDISPNQAHPFVTRAMATKFYKYVDDWCKASVTEAHFKQCYDWFMGRDIDSTSSSSSSAKSNPASSNNGHTVVTTQVQHTDISKTPYRIFNKYKCK